MIPAGVRIWAAAAPVDMRRGLFGLVETTRELLAQDPGAGALYLFTNKRRDRLKLIWHDRTGFCLLYKILLCSLVAPRRVRAVARPWCLGHNGGRS